MAKAKPRKQATMRIYCWAGTPNEQETKTVDTATKAKSFLGDRIRRREKWASRYNHATEAQLRQAREQLDEVDIAALKPGARRAWSATDDYTGVTFVHGFEVQAK